MNYFPNPDPDALRDHMKFAHKQIEAGRKLGNMEHVKWWEEEIERIEAELNSQKNP